MWPSWLRRDGTPPRFDRSAVSLIRRNVQTLSRLLSELLDLTHIVEGYGANCSSPVSMPTRPSISS